jgi:hypothetical protein
LLCSSTLSGAQEHQGCWLLLCCYLMLWTFVIMTRRTYQHWEQQTQFCARFVEFPCHQDMGTWVYIKHILLASSQGLNTSKEDAC